jgi:hypothetical protein
MPIGRWGVLYPPAAFDAAAADRELLLSLAPADTDLWLCCMSALAGTQSRRVLPPQAAYSRPLPSAGDALATGNDDEAGQDIGLLLEALELRVSERAAPRARRTEIGG